MTRRLAALLFGLVAASPAAAQAPDDATRLEPVVVTVTRMEQKAGDAPASVPSRPPIAPEPVPV